MWPQGLLVAGFMFGKLKTNSLVLIALGSPVCFLLSPFIASHIGNLADQLLAAMWVETKDPATVWSFMAAGEYIYAVVLITIALISLICGVAATRTLYKRKHLSV